VFVVVVLLLSLFMLVLSVNGYYCKDRHSCGGRYHCNARVIVPKPRLRFSCERTLNTLKQVLHERVEIIDSSLDWIQKTIPPPSHVGYVLRA